MDLRKEFHSGSKTGKFGDELALIFSIKLGRRSLAIRNEAWGSGNGRLKESLEGLGQLQWAVRWGISRRSEGCLQKGGPR